MCPEEKEKKMEGKAKKIRNRQGYRIGTSRLGADADSEAELRHYTVLRTIKYNPVCLLNSYDVCHAMSASNYAFQLNCPYRNTDYEVHTCIQTYVGASDLHPMHLTIGERRRGACDFPQAPRK